MDSIYISKHVELSKGLQFLQIKQIEQSNQFNSHLCRRAVILPQLSRHILIHQTIRNQSIWSARLLLKAPR